MITPTTRKRVEDLAQGDYIRPRREWLLATGPAYRDSSDRIFVPVVFSTGEADPLPLSMHVGPVEVADDNVVPSQFTSAGLRRSADRIQARVNQLTEARDRLLALAYAQDEERK